MLSRAPFYILLLLISLHSAFSAIKNKKNHDKTEGHSAIAELDDEEWSYDESDLLGPSKWHKQYGNCSGQSQSPIAFYRNDIVINPNLTDIDFKHYDRELTKDDLKVVNNGHTFEIDLKKLTEAQRPSITSASLGATYKLVQLHFHWSHDDTQGSEHVVGDTRNYPLVSHWVHTKDGMEVEKAMKQWDGLAVLAVTFELANYHDHRTEELDKITKYLSDVRYKDDERDIGEKLTLRNLIPKDTSNYFRYNGSLTTPPCSEAVIWTVFTSTINVTTTQLHEFRNLQSNKKTEKIKQITKNYRPTQPLNGRKVELRYEIDYLVTRGAKGMELAFGTILAAILQLVIGYLMVT